MPELLRMLGARLLVGAVLAENFGTAFGRAATTAATTGGATAKGDEFTHQTTCCRRDFLLLQQPD